MLAELGPPTVFSGTLCLRSRSAGVDGSGFFSLFGDESIVVGAVVAVRGRSALSPETAAADVGGSFPVSSSFLIRDFRSSSSSHTVSAVCESTELESGSDRFGSELSAGDSSCGSCGLPGV